jgi:hypothetical protein
LTLQVFAGSCHNWRLQWVLQCRIWVVSPMQLRWVFYLLRKIYFYILWICKMYSVLWIQTDHMMKYMFWIIWLVWLCSIISMMFKNWCMREECWIGLKCFEYVLRLRFKLYKIVWEHVMLKLFMFYEETMFWMISKYLMKCWIYLVLRELDLVTAWFYSMI